MRHKRTGNLRIRGGARSQRVTGALVILESEVQMLRRYVCLDLFATGNLRIIGAYGWI